MAVVAISIRFSLRQPTKTKHQIGRTPLRLCRLQRRRRRHPATTAAVAAVFPQKVRHRLEPTPPFYSEALECPAGSTLLSRIQRDNLSGPLSNKSRRRDSWKRFGILQSSANVCDVYLKNIQRISKYTRRFSENFAGDSSKNPRRMEIASKAFEKRMNELDHQKIGKASFPPKNLKWSWNNNNKGRGGKRKGEWRIEILKNLAVTQNRSQRKCPEFRRFLTQISQRNWKESQTSSNAAGKGGENRSQPTRYNSQNNNFTQINSNSDNETLFGLFWWTRST